MATRDIRLLRLMLITDRRVAKQPWLEVIAAALRGGVTAVMLREKDLPPSELLDAARELRALTRQARALLIVNGRDDVAVASDADGVHLGWKSRPPAEVRGIVGTDRLIGVSTHAPDECRRAAETGADYVTFGPVFSTPSKEGLVEVQGLAGVRRARIGLGIPLLGLGGIDAANAGSVVAAGADGVALIRAIGAAADAEEAAREMAAALA